jgi:hypothetical protein
MLKNLRGTRTINLTEVFGLKQASDLLYRCEVNREFAMQPFEPSNGCLATGPIASR